ncbi:MAG: hypothetical protein II797_03745 [Clostridia bacterium]|nr:hypothetical protein [Clostridia bacterium]
MRKHLIRAVVFLFLTSLLFPLLSSGVSAEVLNATVLPSEIADYLFDPDAALLDSVEEIRTWMPLSGSEIASAVDGDGTYSLIVTASEGAAPGLYKTFPSVPVSPSTECAIPCFFEGEGTSSLYIVFTTEFDSYRFLAEIPANDACTVYLDFSSLHGQHLTSLSMELVPNGTSAVRSFRVYPIRLHSLRLFSCLSETGMVLFAGENSRLSRSGETFSFASDGTLASALAVYPAVRNVEGYLRLVLSVEESIPDFGITALKGSGERLSLGAFSVSAGEHEYLIPVLESDLAGYLFSCEGSGVSVLSFTFLTCSLPAEEESGIGQITSCRISEDRTSVGISGRISSAAVASYIGQELLVFETDRSGTPLSDEPLEKLPISTRFSFTLPISSVDLGSSFLRVFIRSSGELIPVSQAVIVTGGEGKLLSEPSVGLFGPSAANTLLSNATSAIVEISLDRLFASRGTQNEKILPVGGTVYSLDSDYLKQLDRLIEFYGVSEVDVYLRFVVSEPMEEIGLTFPGSLANHYCLNALDEKSAEILKAVAGFLFSRYPSIHGVIPGKAWDSPALSGAGSLSLSDYILNLASLSELLYRQAVRSHPDVTLLLPFALEEGESFYDSLLIFTRVASLLERNGGVPYVLLFTNLSSARDYSAVGDFLFRVAINRDIPAPALEFDLSATSTQALPYYLSDICKGAESAGYRTLFLDLPDSLSASFLGELKTTICSFTGARLVSVPVFEGTGQNWSSYSLWDFTSSFDSRGWLSDGSFPNPLTAASPEMASYLGISGARTLLAKTDSSLENRLILSRIPTALPTGKAPYLVLTIMAEGGANPGISVLLGNDTDQAEFRAALSGGEVTVLVCDLSSLDFKEGINYIAVSCDRNVSSLYLSRIDLCSATLTEEELEQLMDPQTVEPDDSVRLLPLILLIVVTLALTVGFLVLLSHRNQKQKNS